MLKLVKSKYSNEVHFWNILFIFKAFSVLKFFNPSIFLRFKQPENINDISCLFYGCSSLLSIPDISNWHTEKVKDISYLFYECSSLESLPDISKWNFENLSNITHLFYGCSSLKSLPDISKWNIENINDISYLFYG